MIMDVKRASRDQINAMVARIVEHQTCFQGMSSGDVQWMFQNPKESITLIRREVENRNKAIGTVFETEYFKLISGGEKLVIDQCNGSRTIVNSGDVFSFIDPDFCDWNINGPSQPTNDSLVNVFELVNNGRFTNIFDSFLVEKDKLCLTQNQIIIFVIKHHNWLRGDSDLNFFLFKSKNNYFVAIVRYNMYDKLVVHVRSLNDNHMWYSEHHNRVIVPQLIM